MTLIILFFNVFLLKNENRCLRRNNKSSSFNFVKLLVNSYNHLLNTLNILVDLKIVHYDLKGNNIMFDSSNQLPLILDFGLSIKMDEIKKENLTKVKKN